MSERMKIAVIGCGKIAQMRHIPELSEHPEVELVAFCDTNTQRARELADKYHVVRVFSEFRDLLACAELDGVAICTPNSFHAEMGMLALQAGKHVLLEKPMAIEREACRLMVETAKKQNKVLLVGHNQRLHPVYRRAKQIIQSGIMGKVIQFTANFQHGGPELWSIDGANNWFLQRDQAGLGVLGDLGVHKIDMIRWMLDDSIDDISAYIGRQRKTADVEDNAVIMMRLSGGSLGTVSLSWSNPLQDHRTVFYGEKGNLILGESLDGIQLNLHSGEQRAEKAAFAFRQDGGICSGVIEEFFRCMRAGSDRDSALNGDEALLTMNALFKLLP
jgi:UDP-N-acetylglucosamine 3-dehydrogenase